jgi:hypothetical protein
MPVIITAKKNGFRRCNAAHAATPTTYPDGHWTEAQLAILRADPNLIVVETTAKPEEPKPAQESEEKVKAALLPSAEATAKPEEPKPKPKPDAKKSDGKPGGGK